MELNPLGWHISLRRVSAERNLCYDSGDKGIKVSLTAAATAGGVSTCSEGIPPAAKAAFPLCQEGNP
jgi:hypothetical protein